MKKGFTLIELLVVVLIIGILSAVALPMYQSAVRKARLTNLWTQINALEKAQEIYYLTNGTYAENLEDLDIQIPLDTDKYIYKNGVFEEAPWYVSVAFRPGTAGTEKGAAAGYCDYGIARLWGEYYKRKMILVVDCITYQGWKSVRRDVCLKYGGSMSGTGDFGVCVFK